MAALQSTEEENLRYFSSIGDEEAVNELICRNVDVNSRNSMNGWTALHWAAYRKHHNIVRILLNNGANPNIKNNKGQEPWLLANDADIKTMLGANDCFISVNTELPIKPSYLKYPALQVNCNCRNKTNQGKHETFTRNITDNYTKTGLILKVRPISCSSDSQYGTDFIEIELNKDELNFETLINICCRELEITRPSVKYIRKRPDTVVRNDSDVKRFKNYQELEIVLRNL